MTDGLMLELGDIEDVSEDEAYEAELKEPRVSAAERAHDRRWKWLQFKAGVNLKRRKKRAKAKRKAVTSG